MKRAERREKSKSRKDYFALTAVWAYVFTLIFRIVLVHLAGENGAAYFSVANELFLVISCIFSYGLSEAVAQLVRYRIKREQYRSAKKVLQGAIFSGGSLGLILSLVFGFFGHAFAENVMQIPLAGLAVCMMSPAIFFTALTGIMKGYFQGNGSRVPAIHSQIINVIFTMAGGIIGASLFYRYGEKVSDLLQNKEYANAYGAMGAAIGILTASILCFLHMLFLYLVFNKAAKKQDVRETQKNYDTGFHIFHMLITTTIPFAVFALLFQIFPLLDLFLIKKLTVGEPGIIGLWGNYYGKTLAVIGIIGGLISLGGVEAARRIVSFQEREEYRSVRDIIGTEIHQNALIVIPAAVFTAVLAENILDLLFQGNNEESAAWLMAGSVCMVFFVFSQLFSNILVRYRKMKFVIAYTALALALHIAVIMILLQNAKINIMALVIGTIVFYTVTAIAGFVLVSRIFQYRQEWFKTFAVTVIAAAISGLIAMLLNRVFAPMIGAEITLAICLPVGIICYIILLIVIRGVTERELQYMKGGQMIIKIGKLLRFM